MFDHFRIEGKFTVHKNAHKYSKHVTQTISHLHKSNYFFQKDNYENSRGDDKISTL